MYYNMYVYVHFHVKLLCVVYDTVCNRKRQRERERELLARVCLCVWEDDDYLIRNI